ncbi:glycosyltransferase [Desulfurococcaceae archaeon MEX13E-LK6-19]|nr:glycosyltransferase [Desulfurococcaceae archaeon MEX13E-LK6-19]
MIDPGILSLIAVGIIAIPSMFILLLQGLFYICGKKCPKKSFNVTSEDILRDEHSNRPIVSIIIPVRKEPLEYIDDALNNLSEWSIRDKIEIIIVSDDTKDYALQIQNLVNKWRQKGLNIIFLWRSEPRGFRTGALNTGLWASIGETVYIMDVDSRINESFIIKGVKLIRTKAMAVVGRWSAKNKDTRLSEALAHTMDYIVDSIYRGRSCLKLPVFPVGTGTIYDADKLKKIYNGWDEERIQDDMELGARIMYRGDKIIYLDEEEVLVEVPRRFKSFRIQQERWAYGAMDVVISRFKHIIFSKQRFYARIEAFLFLLQYLPLLLALIGIPLAVFVSIAYKIDPFAYAWIINVLWSITAALYIKNYAESAAETGASFYKALVSLGRISAATIALTPAVSKGMILAILRKKYTYKRTPKGVHEHLLGTLRFPTELVLGIIFIITSFYLLYIGILLTGLWLLAYSLGYLYTFMRWPHDIIFK